MSDFPETFHRLIYHKSDDPEHTDNRENIEFLDGYAEGLISRAGIESIGNEWRARGCPEELPEDFASWKRGFNAATMRKTWTNGGPREAGEDVGGGCSTRAPHSAPQGAQKP